MITISKGFADEELLQYIEEITSKLTLQKGIIGGERSGGSFNTEKRRADIAWMDDLHIKMIACNHITKVNAESLGFDLYPFHCEMQYSEYTEQDKGHHHWHEDDSPLVKKSMPSSRKWSGSLLLNTYGKDYEGGELEFPDKIDTSNYTRGTFIVFPSMLQHRVAPVTKGIRKSLVFFFQGPRWR